MGTCRAARGSARYRGPRAGHRARPATTAAPAQIIVAHHHFRYDFRYDLDW